MAVTGMLMCLVTMTGCGSDDAVSGGDDTPSAVTGGKGPYFIAVKSDAGTEYVMQATSLTAGDLNIRDNILELPEQEYTWVFQNHDAIGVAYNYQFAGLGYGLRWTSDKEPLRSLQEFRITNRYTNFGFFDGQFVTSVSGQLSADGTRNDGATFDFWDITADGVRLNHSKTIWTEDLTGNGEQVTFSSIVDEGDGTFLTAMVESSFHQTGTGDGSSVGDVRYPDSVWVARMDRDLRVLHVFRDDRLTYAAGMYRSQVFQEVFRADDGTVYVFSNASNSAKTGTTRKAGALRIRQGADTFDKDYYFDLQTPADGYKFRRVWHVTGSVFLLELYNEKEVTTITVGHHYALVDMERKTFTKVTGLPAKNLITSGAETGGVPLSADGVIYLPVTEYGHDAAIYLVNPTTGVATKGITLKGVKEIRTIGKLN